MILGLVRHPIVATIKHPGLSGRRLLAVDLIDSAQRPTGRYVVAVDSVDAGPGQTVLMVDEGNSARQILGDSRVPIRTVIVGIVDTVTLT
jgi:ethanolamine utilization protein EutN